MSAITNTLTRYIMFGHAGHPFLDASNARALSRRRLVVRRTIRKVADALALSVLCVRLALRRHELEISGRVRSAREQGTPVETIAIVDDSASERVAVREWQFARCAARRSDENKRLDRERSRERRARPNEK